MTEKEPLKLFYKSTEVHSVASEGMNTSITIDMAYDYLRISIETNEHCSESGKVKSHLQHVIECIEELEKDFAK